ncbi:MAG: acyl-CoA thioesterase [Myxococcota bacterium]
MERWSAGRYEGAVHRSAAHLPRHAFSPFDRARASAVWRAFQESAVLASTAAGWPPRRYREAGTAFVVRSMSVLHHREAVYGDGAVCDTWVRRMRRDMLSTRELRLLDEHGECIAAGTQEWVHVREGEGPARADESLTTAFPIHGSDTVAMPELVRLDEPVSLPDFTFRVWNVWMDPLGHVNHPTYIDFGDEAVERALPRPLARLVPVAESVTYLRGLMAGDEARVETQRVGTSGDAAAFEQRVYCGDTVCARVHLVRALEGGSLADVLQA